MSRITSCELQDHRMHTPIELTAFTANVYIFVCVLVLTLTVISIAGLTYIRSHGLPLSRSTPRCSIYPPHKKPSTLHELSRRDISSVQHPSIVAGPPSCSALAEVDLETGHQAVQVIVTPPTPIKRALTSRR